MKLVCIHCHAAEPERVSIYRLEVHPAMLELLQELGILEAEGDTVALEELLRVKRILQLRKSLSVSLEAATIIADLLARLEDMHQEIRRLQEGR